MNRDFFSHKFTNHSCFHLKKVHEIDNTDSKEFKILQPDELQIELSPSQSSSTNYTDETLTIPTQENFNPTEIKSETNQLIFDSEKPLDLSKPIEILDSDDEAEVITIDSDNDDDDDHKEHLQKILIKNDYSMLNQF